MIARGLATTAAAQPVIWSLLGYQFEAASMLAGLSACLTLRVWVSLHDRPTRWWAWGLDLTVTAMSLLFTAGWIVLHRPSPFYALLVGTGFGALGAGVIAIALAWVRRMAPLAALNIDATLGVEPLADDADPLSATTIGEDGGRYDR